MNACFFLSTDFSEILQIAYNPSTYVDFAHLG